MDWIIGVIILLLIAFYLTSVFPTQWLKIERVDVPIPTKLKILQISDWHVERNRISLTKLRTLIDGERPDILCLTGDFLDFASSFILLVPFLKLIQSTEVPAYAVLGNHDYRLKNPDSLKSLLEEYGITILENQSMTVRGINLVGIDDFRTNHHDEDAAFQSVNRDKPIIIMTHDPTITMFMQRKFDYLFAGHLHGKQFNVPFIFKFMDMGPLAASGVYQGTHRCPKGLFYISKGAGQSGFNFRFLVRSEVTIHQLGR